MMLYNRLIILIIFFTLLMSSNIVSESILIEELKYTVTMKNIVAGESNISIYQTSLGNKPVYKIISETRTNKLVDLIYKIRDKVIMLVNRNNYSLLHVTKKINQGAYIKRYSSIIDYEELKIFYKGTEIPIDGDVYDPLGIILNLRSQKFKENNSFSFMSYNKKKLQNIHIIVKGKEVVKVPKGEYNCWIVEPTLESYDSSEETMKIWISADSLALPVKIEKHGKYGTMLLSLYDYHKYE